MNSHSNRRMQILIIWGIAMVAIILLAGSLSPLDLYSSKRLQPVFTTKTEDASVVDARENYLLFALTVLSALIILLSLVSVIILLFSPKTRRKVLFQVFCLLLYGLLFSLVFSNQLNIPANPIALLPSLVLPGGEAQRITFDPNPSNYLIWAVNLGLTLLVVMIFVRVARSIFRQRRNEALQRLAKASQVTLEAIHAGADFESTVLDCYQKMVNVVSRDRDISRPRQMTPREFASYLVKAGLPEPPLQQLTLLFERVRYGAKIDDAASSRKAVESLEEIVAFCRRSV